MIRIDANGKAEAASDPRGRGASQVITLTAPVAKPAKR
jgi:hypothetical protein